MDKSEIESVIQTYFDASYESIGENMREVFHSVSHVYGHEEAGALRDMNREAFIKVVEARRHDTPVPDHPKQNEIISIDFTSEKTAVARVKLRVGRIIFTDILSFIYLDGKWTIIAKLFAGVPVE